jgi:hypothetical protein
MAGQVESRISIEPALTAATNRGGFHATHAAGADQQVGLEAELRHADQMQLLGAASDQRSHGRERASRVVGRQRHARAVGHTRRQLLDRHHRSHARNLCRHSPNCHTPRQFNRWPIWPSPSRLVGRGESK